MRIQQKVVGFVILLMLGGANVAVSETSPTLQSIQPAPLTIGERLGLHYQERVAEFRRQNQTLDPSRRNIVFVGDSLTEGFKLDEYFPGQPVLNRGISSDGIWNSPGTPEYMGLLNRLPESMLETHPRLVFLLIGTNHMPHAGVTSGELMEGYSKIFEQTVAANPGVTFVVHTVPPAGEPRKDRVEFNERTRAFNQSLLKFAEQNSLPVIDLYALLSDENGLLRSDLTGDGIHFRPAAYEIWAAEARKFLE